MIKFLILFYEEKDAKVTTQRTTFIFLSYPTPEFQDLNYTLEGIGLLCHVKTHHPPYLTNPLQLHICFDKSDNQYKYRAYSCYPSLKSGGEF